MLKPEEVKDINTLHVAIREQDSRVRAAQAGLARDEKALADYLWKLTEKKCPLTKNIRIPARAWLNKKA